MNQSKLASLIESLVNTLIGFVVSLLSQLVLFPMFGIHIPITTNLWLCAWFTVISIIRSYVVRRWFNAGIHTVVISWCSAFFKKNSAYERN